jgi:hypothetical protein
MLQMKLCKLGTCLKPKFLCPCKQCFYKCSDWKSQKTYEFKVTCQGKTYCPSERDHLSSMSRNIYGCKNVTSEDSGSEFTRICFR